MKNNPKEDCATQTEDKPMERTLESYAKLDLAALLNKKNTIISSEEALKDVKPVEWGEDMLQGKKSVVIKQKRR